MKAGRFAALAVPLLGLASWLGSTTAPDWAIPVREGKIEAIEYGTANWEATGTEVLGTPLTPSEKACIVFDTSTENFVFHARFPLDGQKHFLNVGGTQSSQGPAGVTLALVAEGNSRRVEVMTPHHLEDATTEEVEAQPTGWCDCEIVATERVRVRLDGIELVDLDLEEKRKPQLSILLPAGHPDSVRWKDLRILPLETEQDFVPLFEGDDLLDGWYEVGPEKWTGKQGVITGETKTGAYGWLVSDKEYGDFVFSFKYRWHHGNSGVQFRSWLREEQMHGYQADIDPSIPQMTAALYDEHERGFLVKAATEVGEAVDPGVWQTYEISAIGNQIRLFHNGEQTVHFVENLPDRTPRGIIALQVHSIQLPEKVRMDWKDLRILVLDPPSPWE